MLREGIVLSIAADVRWETPPNAPADFLGRPLHVQLDLGPPGGALGGPGGADLLRRSSRAGPTPSSSAEPFVVPPAAAKDEGLAADWVQHGLRLIEDRVRRDPANSIDYFFWEPDSAIEPDAPPLAAAG